MIYRIPALLIALTVHEYAHARIAVRLGDPTPRFQGRLTLNPVPHLDPIGLLMLFFFQFGWAKPVEVNARNFKNWREGMMYVALAGPGANLITAFIAMFLSMLCIRLGYMEFWLLFTLKMVYLYNAMFAVFNLLPIPPLDGSKVLVNYLPPRAAYQYEGFAQYGTIVLILLVYAGVISMIIGPIINAILRVMSSVLLLIF